MSGPLRGLRVLDISTIIAAAMAATLLGDFGAEVLKVEMPGTRDGLRGFPPLKDGKSLWWKVTVPRFSVDPGGVRNTGRSPGYDNDSVFRDWLGLDATQMANLSAKKVI